MSRLNDALINTYLTQLYLVAKHQEIAGNNQPNQLGDMVESLNMLTEVIGNSNAVGITNLNNESINIVMERYTLASKFPNKPDNN